MTSELPEDFTHSPPEETSNVNLREELLFLSKKGEIKQTETHIKKASQETLEKIKQDYNRKQLDAANDYISENLISDFSDLLKHLEFVDDSEEMKKELDNNKFFKNELKNLIGYVTPFIPYIGLFCGGVVVARHVFNKKNKDGMQTEQTENTD